MRAILGSVDQEVDAQVIARAICGVRTRRKRWKSRRPLCGTLVRRFTSKMRRYGHWEAVLAWLWKCAWS